MIEIGKIFINDKNGIGIEIAHSEISRDILNTNSENELDKIAEMICIKLNEIKIKAMK